ncbi:STM3941 family protein [Bacillus infantis]|uniref:STM3941 family protein n=1 Tax=Bacillus infantis TaxID=324767 RepID=UPI003CF700BE
MIFDKSPLVSFSTEGLEVNGPGGPGQIAWEDFEGIFPYEVHGNAFLGVIVKDEEKYIERLPARKKRLVKIN